MALPQGPAPTVINNTIVGNTTGIRYSIYTSAASHIYRNNILANNGIGVQGEGSGTAATWENNIVFGNGTDYSGISSQTGLHGNLSVNPQYSTLERSYFKLLPASPAINAGSNSLCPADDFRGLARPQGANCDIGAYEFAPEFSFNSGNYSVREDDLTALISVTLNEPLAASATVQYSTSYGGGPGEAVPGQDYSPASGTLTFTAGSQSQSFSIPLIDDDVAEFPETISLALSNPAGAETVVANDIATLTIDDDDRVFVYLPLCVNIYCSDFFDNFSNPLSGWYKGEDPYVRSEYLNNEYRVLSKAAGYYFFFSAPTCDRLNYTTEVDARWQGTPGSSYGLIFGITGQFDALYIFDVNTDYRQFRLLRIDSQGFTTLVSATYSSAIGSGSAINHLRVTRQGSGIALSVNSVGLGNWSDGAISGLTGMGLMTSSYSNSPSSDARFDNFRVTSLGNGPLGPGAPALQVPQLTGASSGFMIDAGDGYATGSGITGWH